MPTVRRPLGLSLKQIWRKLTTQANVSEAADNSRQTSPTEFALDRLGMNLSRTVTHVAGPFPGACPSRLFLRGVSPPAAFQNSSRKEDPTAESALFRV